MLLSQQLQQKVSRRPSFRHIFGEAQAQNPMVPSMVHAEEARQTQQGNLWLGDVKLR